MFVLMLRVSTFRCDRAVLHIRDVAMDASGSHLSFLRLLYTNPVGVDMEDF